MTAPVKRPASRSDAVPALANGDHLDRLEFERRYNAMPEVKKAELIEGVVYMPSPVRHRHHSNPHSISSPGWGCMRHAPPVSRAEITALCVWIMENEPQPDAYLIVLPSHGGKVVIDDDDYISGGPELVAEVSASSVSIDLNGKQGVLPERRPGIRRLARRRWGDRLVRSPRRRVPSAAARCRGIYRSEVLPGFGLTRRPW